MARNRNDARPVGDRLQEALAELCEHEDYYAITVDRICKAAGTYRSTFYLHYGSKDELLRAVEERYVAELNEAASPFSQYHPKFDPDEYGQYREGIVQVMRYHYSHRKLCRFLLSPEGDPHFGKLLRSNIRQIDEEGWHRNSRKPLVSPKYSSNFFVSGYIATIYEWLCRDDRTPEQMADFLMGMIGLFSEKCH
jgi:AcrR family transcriptional regulator